MSSEVTARRGASPTPLAHDAQVVERVQAADVGQHRPAEADGQRDDRKLLIAEAGGEGGDRARDRTSDDVGREQLAAQLRLRRPAGGSAGMNASVRTSVETLRLPPGSADVAFVLKTASLLGRGHHAQEF